MQTVWHTTTSFLEQFWICNWRREAEERNNPNNYHICLDSSHLIRQGSSLLTINESECCSDESIVISAPKLQLLTPRIIFKLYHIGVRLQLNLILQSNNNPCLLQKYQAEKNRSEKFTKCLWIKDFDMRATLATTLTTTSCQQKISVDPLMEITW